MLLSEIIAVYSDNHTKNGVSKIFNIKTGGVLMVALGFMSYLLEEFTEVIVSEKCTNMGPCCKRYRNHGHFKVAHAHSKHGLLGTRLQMHRQDDGAHPNFGGNIIWCLCE